MKACVRWLALVGLLGAGAVALAERPPQSREKADLVVVGKVAKVTATERPFGGDGVITDYTAQVEVSEVEGGKGSRPGQAVRVHWFHATKRPSKPFVGAFGHAYPLKAGDRARFWLMRKGKDEGWEVIYNSDGVEKLKK